MHLNKGIKSNSLYSILFFSLLLTSCHSVESDLQADLNNHPYMQKKAIKVQVIKFENGFVTLRLPDYPPLPEELSSAIKKVEELATTYATAKLKATLLAKNYKDIKDVVWEEPDETKLANNVKSIIENNEARNHLGKMAVVMEDYYVENKRYTYDLMSLEKYGYNLYPNGMDEHIEHADTKFWVGYVELEKPQRVLIWDSRKGFMKSNSHLRTFILNGNLAKVTLLLKNGVKPYSGDLNEAVKKGEINIVEALLANKVDVNGKIGSSGHSAISSAVSAKLNSIKIINILLEHGANANIKDNYGYNALGTFAENGNLDAIKILVNNGAEIKNSKGDVAVLNGLFKKGESAGNNALFNIGYAEKNRIEIAKYLINKGMDVNAKRAYDGHTPLHSAMAKGHLDIVRLFVENGANINAEDNNGKTPIILAQENGHNDVVDYLSSR